MGSKRTEKRIGEAEYSITQHPARQGLALQVRLAKLVAPSIGALIGAVNFQGGKIEINDSTNFDLDKIKDAMIELASRLEPNDFEKMVSDLLTYTMRDGRQVDPLTIDEAFAGKYDELFAVLFEVIKLNGFFALGGIGKALQRYRQTQSSEQDSEPQPTQ